LTYTNKALAPSGLKVEKPRSPAGTANPAWCQECQRRIENAQREYLLLKSQEEPDEAPSGQGEVEMNEASTNLGQKQLSGLGQQIVHVIQSCKEEKDILEEEFDCLKNVITIMESRLQMEKVRIDSEVQGVGSSMLFQQAVLEQLRWGIHVVQEQDNKIVGEAADLFAGI